MRSDDDALTSVAKYMGDVLGNDWRILASAEPVTGAQKWGRVVGIGTVRVGGRLGIAEFRRTCRIDLWPGQAQTAESAQRAAGALADKIISAVAQPGPGRAARPFRLPLRSEGASYSERD